MLNVICRGDVTTYGWCFLENIEDPTDPTKNCFSDALWSHTHGRFWSHVVIISGLCQHLVPFVDSNNTRLQVGVMPK